MSDETWRVCSTCKKPIGFERDYFRCSVSTCNRKRTGLFFCSVQCWDAHLPFARHRDAWAEPAVSPSKAEWEAEQAEEQQEAAAAPVARSERARRIVDTGGSDSVPKDTLVVVTKLKGYIRARSGMNTSDNVVGVLSDHLRRLCDLAADFASRDGRRTVMDRDFEKIFKSGSD